MSNVRSVMNIHLKDKWSWFYIPWMVLGSSFLVNLIIASSVTPETGENMTTGGLMSIFVYVLFAGLFSLAQTYPFALGFSVRRIDYLLGTAGTLSIVSALVSAALVILAFVEHELTGGWGVDLNFFHMPFLEDLHWIGRFALYFLLFFHLYAVGFVIASIYRRFGKNGVFSFFIAWIAVMTLVGYAGYFQGWWADLFHWLRQFSVVEALTWTMLALAVANVVYSWISYLLIRRATA